MQIFLTQMYGFVTTAVNTEAKHPVGEVSTHDGGKKVPELHSEG